MQVCAANALIWNTSLLLPICITKNARLSLFLSCQNIWTAAPLKPIYSTDLAKWGAVYPGRSEGRVIASLKYLKMIGQKRDGGIMLRHFPGRDVPRKPPSPKPLAETSPWHPSSSTQAKNDDDRVNADELYGPKDPSLRYVAGSRHCSKRSLPVVYVAPFMQGLVKRNPLDPTNWAYDDKRWDERRSPMNSKCGFREKGVPKGRVLNSILEEKKSGGGGVGPLGTFVAENPRLCQAKCGAAPRCFFFSFSKANETCTLHDAFATR